MSARRLPWLATLVAGVLLAAGCSTAATDTRAETAGLPDVREEVEDEVWRVDPDDLAGPATITLEIEGDDLRGTTPCGPYRGEAHLDHDDLELTDVTGGDGPCSEDEQRTVADYLAALARATSAEVDDVHLVLEGDDVRLELDETDD